jgi:hypothetical protein
MSPTTDTDDFLEAVSFGFAAVRDALFATAATALALFYSVTKTIYPTSKSRNRRWWRSTAPAAVAAVLKLQQKQFFALYKEHCETVPSKPVFVPAMLSNGQIVGNKPLKLCSEQPVTSTVAAAQLLGTQIGIDQSDGRVLINDAADRTTATNKPDCSTPSVQLRLFEVTLNSRTIDVSCNRF